MVYLMDYENDGAERTVYGPFTRIVIDSVRENGFVLLCYSPEHGAGRFFVRSVEIISSEELQERM